MGICHSCQSASVSSAVLILEDGRLQEFPYPVWVSEILQENPSCFVASAADMEFDNYIPAVDEEDEIQPDQIYFVLPLSWQNNRLRAEEMAALAVKASLAMGRRDGHNWLRRRKWVIPDQDLMTSGDRVTEEACPLVAGGGTKRRRRIGGGKAKEFTTTLHIIVEE